MCVSVCACLVTCTPERCVHTCFPSRRGSRIQKGGFVQEFRLENRSYPDVHDFSLRMQVIIANDYVAFELRKVTIDLKVLEFIVLLLMEVEYV